MSAGPHRQGELHRAARTRSDILRWLAHREAAADASGTVRTLLCGHRSFAARGLAEALEGAGHQVVRFSRGEVGRAQRSVSGPVDLLDVNPHLREPFDAVINYIVLKDEPAESNARYAAALLRLCAERAVPHLVHVSSISVYRRDVAVVREDSPVEADPSRKGAYGALKVATERFLVDHRPGSLAHSLLRPGFVLGEGLASPIVGTGFKLPWNRLLAVGDGASVLPLVSRAALTEAVFRLLASAPAPGVEAYLLAHPASPSRREYLQACCERLGCGTGVTCLPTPVWWLGGLAAEAAARLTGRGGAGIFARVRSACRRQSFDPGRTESRLGLSFAFDWRQTLQHALPGQETVRLPYVPPLKLPRTAARRVTFVGYGRIVHERHRPALRRLGFEGTILAHDLQPRRDADGTEVTALPQVLEPADLVVVASPGPAHTTTLGLLAAHEGGVLVEKPLCSSSEELGRWVGFAEARRAPTLACHNYRLKPNVGRMLDCLRRYHAGALLHVHLDFESPSVAGDAAPWRRQERAARTLLVDYALHFLDLACMFDREGWEVHAASHLLDGNGATALIEGRLGGPRYPVSFVLRQGFGRRAACLDFTFQNYSVRLGFFPDTFSLRMADDNPILQLREAVASLRATAAKGLDRLRGRESDPSHALAFAAALGEAPALQGALDVRELRGFYQALFRLGERVYGA